MVETKRYLGDAVLTTRSNGTSQEAYVLRDHLGSPTLIVDQNGQVLQNQSFDAFGQRRAFHLWASPIAPSAFNRIVVPSPDSNDGEQLSAHALAEYLVGIEGEFAKQSGRQAEGVTIHVHLELRPRAPLRVVASRGLEEAQVAKLFVGITPPIAQAAQCGHRLASCQRQSHRRLR